MTHSPEGPFVMRAGLTRLDVASAEILVCEASRSVRGRRTVVLDMGDVAAVDRAGLCALLRISQLLPPGSTLRLAGCAPSVRHALQDANLSLHLPSFDTVGRALSAPL
ncbi:MAG: STAS domain-containing protein [Myxococcales bacterium]|nr:STAS domain-containing protein [Myxococcales bacterium]